MTLHAAWKMDTEGVAAARKEIAMIKFYGAQVLHDVVDRALQAHGSLGYSTDLPLEAMYRYCARGADLRRPRRGPPRVGRAAGAARLRGAGRRGPERAHPDPARGGAAAVRRPARGRHGQRLIGAARARRTLVPTLSRRWRPMSPREAAAGRAARLLRRRRPRRADGRAGARAVRRAGVRAQGDRPQQARRRAAARSRRGVRRVRDRGAGGRDGRVLAPTASRRASTPTPRARSCRRSTRPARW